MKNDGRVSASEIAEFIYCKRAWYLRSQGLLETTDLMHDGTRQHAALFEKTSRLALGKIIALSFIILGIILLVILLLLPTFLS